MSTKNRDPQALLEVKIGVFVVVLLLAGAGVIFLLGQKKHVFEERATLYVKFKDVSGLRDGAPVRLSGLNVGAVTRVALAKDTADPRVHVELEVTKDVLDRIRKDSAVRIGAQGLLGDKLVEISLGSPAAPAVAPGEELRTEDAPDLNRVVSQAGDVMEKFKSVADNAANLMTGLGDPKTVANVRGSISSMRAILHAVEKGPGLVHGLFYSAQGERQLDQILAELARMTGSVHSSLRHIEQVLGATDGDGTQLVNNLSRAAKSIGKVASEVSDSKMIPELQKASSDVAQMTQFIKSGRGSIGGLIVDPTLYHQLLSIVGGVERSRLLRSLVRYTVGKEDTTGRVVDVQRTPPAQTQGTHPP